LGQVGRSLQVDKNIESEQVEIGIKIYDKANRYRINKPNGL